jgi:putative ABC transport system permease protein
MKTVDVVRDAVRNTARNKVRTSLTVVAIFIGAFTLTLTNSIGAGVSSYIDDQVGSIGSPTVVTVSKPVADAGVEDDGPEKYEPSGGASVPSFGLDLAPLSEADVEKVRQVENIDSVELTYTPRPDFVEGANGEKFVADVNLASSVMIPDLVAGSPFTAGSDDFQVLLPPSYVEALGFGSADEAVGEKVSFGVTDATFVSHTVDAVVVGVQNKSLFGESLSLNNALSAEVAGLNQLGAPEVGEKTYWSVIGHFGDDVTAAEQDQIKADLEDLGLSGSTVKDQLGSINAVINGIIGVLNGFAVIALIAAGFGIVNTLLMSVQERTREIGLMKAMGMSGKKIYLLFSAEAVFIGFLGSALGAGAAIGLGSVISGVLSNGLLADLPGLTITVFTVPAVAGVILLVMFIAFLAGTIPAQRAAKQNAIDALRYE